MNLLTNLNRIQKCIVVLVIAVAVVQLGIMFCNMPDMVNSFLYNALQKYGNPENTVDYTKTVGAINVAAFFVLFFSMLSIAMSNYDKDFGITSLVSGIIAFVLITLIVNGFIGFGAPDFIKEAINFEIKETGGGAYYAICVTKIFLIVICMVNTGIVIAKNTVRKSIA